MYLIYLYNKDGKLILSMLYTLALNRTKCSRKGKLVATENMATAVPMRMKIDQHRTICGSKLNRILSPG